MVKKLRLLLSQHPNAVCKIGVGIDHFFIQRNQQGAGKGIRFMRVDGSVDSFSYRKCLGDACRSLYRGARSNA
ncbi:DUF3223 domain-containing protein [Pseudomonas sp. RIT-To-2]|uniref:DUF3223 domain-containing protein n=1 Tax=Pseudomonas sp. RIT-To-2 TaxID=3462541 RepID=UPI0040481A10